MDTLPTILLRALFNVHVSITNIIVKLAVPGALATATCKLLVIRTSADDWRKSTQVCAASQACI